MNAKEKNIDSLPEEVVRVVSEKCPDVPSSIIEAKGVTTDGQKYVSGEAVVLSKQDGVILFGEIYRHILLFGQKSYD